MCGNRSFYAFTGWDEPPQAWGDAAGQPDELEHEAGTNAENSRRQVLWEIGLVLAIPFVLAVIVEMVLRAFQIA
jgi:hypothetical protein